MSSSGARPALHVLLLPLLSAACGRLGYAIDFADAGPAAGMDASVEGGVIGAATDASADSRIMDARVDAIADGGNQPRDGARADAGTAVSCLGQCSELTYRWDRTAGDTSLDSARGFAVDAAGNVFLVGSFSGRVDFGGGERVSVGTSGSTPGSEDAFLASYGPDGSYRWDRVFGGPGQEQANGVALDASSRVVVVGSFQDGADLGGGTRTSSGGSDGFIARLGSTGSYQWDRTFGGGQVDRASDVAVDSEGNVIVTGAFRLSVDLGGGPRAGAGRIDGFVASFASDGTYRWDRTFGDSQTDLASGVAVDSDGNVAVAGRFELSVDLGGGVRTATGGGDGFVASYGPAGAYRWDRTFGDVGGGAAAAVGVDAEGNVTVAGYFDGTVDFGGMTRSSGGSTSAFLASYGPAGRNRWVRVHEADSVGSAAVTPAGNAVLAGRSSSAVDFGGGERTGSGNGFLFVVGHGPEGDYYWDYTFDAATSLDFPNAVAADDFGNVLLGGNFRQTVDFGGGPRSATGLDDMFMLGLGCECGT